MQLVREGSFVAQFFFVVVCFQKLTEGNFERMRECVKRRERREGRESRVVYADVKGSRSQRFPLNLEQTTNTECLPKKAEWLIVMAACFGLVLSDSQHCFLKTAVSSGLTCGHAYHLQLHIKHLADALIPTQWQRGHKTYSVCGSCDPMMRWS